MTNTDVQATINQVLTNAKKGLGACEVVMSGHPIGNFYVLTTGEGDCYYSRTDGGMVVPYFGGHGQLFSTTSKRRALDMLGVIKGNNPENSVCQKLRLGRLRDVAAKARQSYITSIELAEKAQKRLEEEKEGE